MVATAPAHAGNENPLPKVIDLVRKDADAQRALETARLVYSTDRWFTFPKFEQTATALKQRLEQGGLSDVEIEGAVADGKTQAGFWTMPLAWDAAQARLELISPERELLCDYQTTPASLGMWSASTAPEGVEAEVIDPEQSGWSKAKGKLVLTSRNSASLKAKLVESGALGAINGFSENPSLRDGRQWINAWGDNGWGFLKTSTPLLSFSVSPAQAERLRALLASGKPVKVHATVATRYYEGRYPWVTGILPGTHRQEEVMVLGHTSEQGAQDNATGVAAMTEALHLLSSLVEQGKLPRPRRSIRVLLMPELYGSMSYIQRHRDRMKNVAAAMTVDTPAASYDDAGTEYTFYLNPHAGSAYVDGLILQIARSYYGKSRPWHWSPSMPGTDSYLSDPEIGIPTVWPYSGTGPVTHHNSKDVLETIDTRSLRDLVCLIATYLYINASADGRDAQWLSQVALDFATQRIVEEGAAGAGAALAGNQASAARSFARIDYLADRGRQSILSVLRVVPPDQQSSAKQQLQPTLELLDRQKQLQRDRLAGLGIQSETQSDLRPAAADASKIIVKRKRVGTLPLDDLPQSQWEGWPSGAWDTLVTAALYWCDGHRNVAEVARLTQLELGPTNFDFVGYFRFLERHGYVEFVH